jgi:hypothetical protein
MVVQYLHLRDTLRAYHLSEQPTGSSGSGRLRENSFRTKRTGRCLWGELLLLVLIAFGRFRQLAGAASLGGLCCIVIAGP